MRTTCLVPGARAGAAGLLAALILLCLPGPTALAGSSARGAEPPTAGPALLATGSGYAQPRGSTRVRVLQRRLRTLGLHPGSVDGLFGPQTRAAVDSFQRTVGLQVDGIVGPHTRRALRRASAPVLGHGTGYGQPGGSREVRKLQHRLSKLGHRPGAVDGLYGPLTAAAVARFQRDRGLAADGVAWPRTRHAIARAGRQELSPAREVDNKRSPRTTRSQSSDRRVDADRARRQSVEARAAQAPDAASNAGDAFELPWLLVSGLLAFALVAVTFPLMDRLAVSAKAVMPALTTVPARDLTPVPARDLTGGSWTAEGEPPAHEPSEPDPSPTPRAEVTAPLPPHAASDAVASGAAVEAVGYLSIIDRAEPGEANLREQIAAMDAFCERRGWRLVEVVRDVGLDRPGLSYALERLAGSEASCLIVAELRRLGGSAAELGPILRWLRDRGVRLVAVDIELDTAAPDGRIAADALISVGELEDGPASGRPAVRHMPALKQHIVAMRSAGMTLQAIANRLNDEGVPTLRGGQRWRPSSVQAAAGYRRPPQPPYPLGHDRRTYRRRAEDR